MLPEYCQSGVVLQGLREALPSLRGDVIGCKTRKKNTGIGLLDTSTGGLACNIQIPGKFLSRQRRRQEAECLAHSSLGFVASDCEGRLTAVSEKTRWKTKAELGGSHVSWRPRNPSAPKVDCARLVSRALIGQLRLPESFRGP